MVMKKKLILGLALLIIFWLGFQGVNQKVCFEENTCKTCYDHYYIKPFIKVFFECSILGKEPCGIHEEVSIYNRKVELIHCLCENPEANNNIIFENYASLRLSYPNLEDSRDLENVCKIQLTYLE